MPNYDYFCEDCNQRFELFHSIYETKAQECPQCSGKKVRKIINSGGVIFKGSGFYVNDNRKDSASE